LRMPGLIKTLIAAAGLLENERVVRIPTRADWSDDAQNASSLCDAAAIRIRLLYALASQRRIGAKLSRTQVPCV
jgi:hypothetical protein